VSSRQIRNIGIVAHVDAGKTTLTEQMLFLAGSIRATGNVDKGTSLSDGLDVEKRRGISVRATTLSFPWRDVQINLIDTPGHVDFSAEVERSIRVLDGAILMLSAVEGIQAHTETIWRALDARGIPVLCFINKIDRAGADVRKVVNDIRRELSPNILLLNQSEDEGDNAARIRDPNEEERQEIIETVAATNDALLERYLEEETLSETELSEGLAGAIRGRAIIPAMCGAAKNGVGTEMLLNGLVDWFPDADTNSQGDPSAVVFRIDHDSRLGRIAGVRLYRGTIQARDVVKNATADRDEKITQIKKSFLNRYEDVSGLEAGDIGFLCGLSEARIGDVLGDPNPVPDTYQFSEPLLSVQAIPEDAADRTRLAESLQLLSSEDPHLDFAWADEERELHVKIMGTVQTEILADILQHRFGIQTTFSEPTVVYKETPSTIGFGEDRYTMPKPCWAIVKYRIEPGEPGSGIRFDSEVGVNDVKIRYQHEIERCLPNALRQGIKGWEVTDLAITLVSGSDHVQHSRPGNFALATHIALLKALTETDTTLLEPVLAFRITGPDELVGKVASDITRIRGTLDSPESAHSGFVLRGRIPLATSMNYTITLSSMTSGRANLSVRFDGYDPVDDELGVIRPYKGICPLDRSKYILKMRGAITESPH
jgi:ribosomal protection tetracycline resistance protein